MGYLNLVEGARAMIRFVYPNVNELDQFVGCGRYLTTTPGDPNLGEQYTLADPQVRRLSSIRSGAYLLAPESDESPREVYECRDSSLPYRGDSVGLAYLLALINRSRRTVWEDGKYSGDIWCTGTIEMISGNPQLGEVFPNQFAIKLRAFLSDPHDRLFMLPLVNLKPPLKRECEDHHVRVVTFAQFKTIPAYHLFETRTIVQLHGHELQELVKFLFLTPEDQEQPQPVWTSAATRLQNLRNFTVQIRKPGAETIAGTGIVVSTDGKIVTCASVVEAATDKDHRQADDAEVDVYFPQVSGDDPKTRRAKVAACLPQYEDDIVLLQVDDEDLLLEQEQIAVLGDAEHSKGNSFETYGYLPSTDSPVTRAGGIILGAIETLPTQTLFSERVQLQSDLMAQELNGAAVLDKTRNLVVGLLSKQYLPKGGTESGRAYAVNLSVLTAEPFAVPGLGLQDSQLPKRLAPQPEPQKPEPAATDLGIAWNNAPASLKTWVGRESLISDIISDWTNPEHRITGLIGFGGEGKSSLARKVVDELLSPSPNLPHQGGGTFSSPPLVGGVRGGGTSSWGEEERPYGVFWWGFYTRPSIDEFFEAALTYMSGGRIDPAMLLSSSERAKVIGAMLHSGHYLFVLDGLEPMQHQQGDRYGLLKNDELRQFLSYFSSLRSQSFCLITSRVPVLDLMDYTSYTHQDVIQLNQADGQELLRKIGVRGADQDLEELIDKWGGHALTLSLLGAYLVEYCDGDVRRTDEIPPPTTKETRYERVNRVLRRYDSHLNEAERAFLMIFSAFRTPVDNVAFDKIFRAKTKKPAKKSSSSKKSFLWKPIAALNTRAFKAMVNRLVAYRILNYDPAADHYTAHPLIIAHYKKLLNKQKPEQVQQVHHNIKEYYLANAGEISEIPTLEELAPLIEAVHHACRACEYDEGFRLLQTNIQQKERFVLSFILGAWDTYLMAMRQLFPNRNTSCEPLVSRPKEKSYLLHEVGFCLMMMGHLKEAIPGYKRAIEIDMNIKNWRDVSCSYLNLTEIYGYFGQLDDGKHTNHESLTMARRAERKMHEVIALADRAWLAHLAGEIEAANQHFQQAEEVQQELDPQTRYLTGLEGAKHSHHLRRAGDSVYAREIIAANLEICEQKSWKDYISLSHRIIGDLEAENGQHKSARAHYDEALKVIRSIARRDILIDILCSRGRWLARHQQDASSAFIDLHEALDYAVNSGYRIYEADIRVALAWAYHAQASSSSLSAEKKNYALASAWQQADRALRMSQNMDYYWGQVDAEEVMRKLEELE
jgi:tetratricopeptide (TPR) repeat protein